MRKVLLMVFAIGMFMALGSAGAAASSGSSSDDDDKPCKYAKGDDDKCKPKPCPAGQERKAGKCKPKPCPAGYERHGSQCKPKPCPPGQERHGSQCKPKPCPAGHERQGSECKPKPCPAGTERHGDECKPKPCKSGEINVGGKCVPRPAQGPCSKADIVLLEDLLKGTGGLLCVYLGNNAPNADKDKNCPEALLALPVDNLIGACLYLPPVEIEGDGGAKAAAPAVSAPSAAAPSTNNLLGAVTSLLGGLLK